MKTDHENTYTEENIELLGVDWDSYEEMMYEENLALLEDDRVTYDDPHVQEEIRSWRPVDSTPEEDVNTVEHWME